MIWRTGPVLLVAIDASFAIIDSAGMVTASFEQRTHSDEDDLWRWNHVVVGDQFLQRTTVETRGDSRHKDEVVLDGLVPVHDPTTLALVAAALASDRVAREAARARADREAAARIAAIPGAREGYGLGEEIARAQAALVDRVRWYADPVATALLRTLVAVARARPDPSVLTAYARGCLHACFMRNIPSHTIAMSAHDPALAKEIGHRAAELDREAEHCEAGDAPGNARAYRTAALELWGAAAALDPPRP